ERRKAQLSLLVRGQGRRTANQRGRADTDCCARQDAALIVLDRADQSARQSLCGSDAGQQHTGRHQQEEVPGGSGRRSVTYLDIHVTVHTSRTASPARKRNSLAAFVFRTSRG